MAMSELGASSRGVGGERLPIQALRGMCFGAIVSILIQYGLGMWVNLFGHLPASDHGKGLFDAFARAVADGPVGLSIHAVFGVILGVMSLQVLVRSFQSRRRVLIVVSVIGVASVIGAAVNGAQFVGSETNGESWGMAVSAGVGLLAYAVGLFALSGD